MRIFQSILLSLLVGVMSVNCKQDQAKETIPVDDQCQEALRWLKDARQSEAKGLLVLERIVENL